jgi:hypothetical protein
MKPPREVALEARRSSASRSISRTSHVGSVCWMSQSNVKQIFPARREPTSAYDEIGCPVTCPMFAISVFDHRQPHSSRPPPVRDRALALSGPAPAKPLCPSDHISTGNRSGVWNLIAAPTTSRGVTASPAWGIPPLRCSRHT